MKNLKAPEHLRKGQALFTFLSWLAKHDKAKALDANIKILTHDFVMDGHFMLGDPFYIPDDQLETLWDEWMASLPKGRP